MKTKKAVKWQSRTPKFPKTGYVVFLRLVSKHSKSKTSMPMWFFAESSNEIYEMIKPLSKQLPKDDGEIVLIKVYFETTLILKKEYWMEKPTDEKMLLDHYKTGSKIINFMGKPAGYRLQVASILYKNKVESFWPVLVYSSKATKRQIERLMSKSMEYVDHSAKTIGIYKAKKPALAVDYNKKNIELAIKHF